MTPNLAAWLQAHAEPDTVLIASTTRSLLGEVFEYRILGKVPIPVRSSPTRCRPVILVR